VYGAETAFPQGVSLGLWFSKGLITTDEVRLHGFELNLALEGKVSAELTDELHFGMIQQERQNNIINILGGHSYAM